MEKKYTVWFNTGFYEAHPETVCAFSEQEAVDKAVDKLEKENSPLVSDFYEIADLCNTGETVDEYAERNNLVCAGNHGLYCSLLSIKEVENCG